MKLLTRLENLILYEYTYYDSLEVGTLNRHGDNIRGSQPEWVGMVSMGTVWQTGITNFYLFIHTINLSFHST